MIELKKKYSLTNELKEKIHDFWKEGKTGSYIAQELGLTRNSVIGFIYRLKQKGFKFKARKKNTPPPPKKAKPFVKKKTTKVKKEIKPVVVEEKKEEFVLDPSTNVTLEGLTYYSCRFIVEDGTVETTKYCGDIIQKSSYCKYHYDICYVPPKHKLKSSQLTN